MTVLTVNLTTDYSAQVLNNVTDILMGNVLAVTATFANTQFDNVAVKDAVNIDGAALALLAHGIIVNGGSVDASGWDFSNWDIAVGSFVELNGSSVSDTFYNSEVRDTISGARGADIIYGGGGVSQGDTLIGGLGSDTFRYLLTTGSIFDVIDGGSGTADKIKVIDTGAYDFRSATISLVEQLQFGAPNQIVTLASDQIGAFGSIQTVTGTNAINTLSVEGSNIDLSAVGFVNWNNSSDTLTLEGTSGDDVLTGSTIADQFIGTRGSDFLTGLEGNDIFIFGLSTGLNIISADIDGGVGIEDSLKISLGGTYDFRSSTLTSVEVIDLSVSGATVFASVDMVGAGGIIEVRGSAGYNNFSVSVSAATTDIDLSALLLTDFTAGEDFVVLSGNGDSNTLIGTALDDALHDGGGFSPDIMEGRGGDDTFYVGVANAGTVIDGGAGTDELVTNAYVIANDVRDFQSVLLESIERLVLLDPEATALLASTQIAGSSGLTEVDGELGGGDLMVLGSDTDLSTLTFVRWKASNSVTLEGTTGDDNLVGSLVSDIFLASDGQDTLSGGAGDDTIDGGDSHDIIAGGAGADSLVGGLNTDTLNYADSAAAVTVNLDSNTASGGDAEGDIISGFERIIGSDHDDDLTGSAGINRLVGGLGQDTLTGGDGADIFRFEAVDDSPNLLADTITDFVQGVDLIDLGAIDADSVLGGNNVFVLTPNGGTGGFTGIGQIRFHVGTVNTTISLNTTGDGTAEVQIKLAGLFSLTAADFIL